MALAIPNLSEARAPATVSTLTNAFTAEAELLDRHTDAVHNRTVLTLAAPEDELAGALLTGARACVELIDMRAHEGAHPCVGALDVCPVIWLTEDKRAAAESLASAAAAALAELGLPVFFYGALAARAERRERAYFRRGGFAALSARMASGELVPDLGPPAAHPTAGAVMVTARPPMAAFNVELDTGDTEVARAIAAELRESGGGLEGVRAIGIDLDGVAQVSTNVHDPIAVPLGVVIERVRALGAERGARPVAAELVGLIPQGALVDLPADVALRGFDPAVHVIEARLEASGGGGR